MSSFKVAMMLNRNKNQTPTGQKITAGFDQLHSSPPQGHGLGKTVMKRASTNQFHKRDLLLVGGL